MIPCSHQSSSVTLLSWVGVAFSSTTTIFKLLRWDAFCLLPEHAHILASTYASVCSTGEIDTSIPRIEAQHFTCGITGTVLPYKDDWLIVSNSKNKAQALYTPLGGSSRSLKECCIYNLVSIPCYTSYYIRKSKGYLIPHLKYSIW